ncbi:hypothetical protein J2S00_001553 [Caldalkalibacillus uzonensis]|uniref:Uncharacterized protein n=1 Tax=Caldalkalibacillus uzonensis TaxID=353224 RepID=A0ABU0CQT0_9BACI|nr:HI_0552 family protein [Caldalkalibacillus uzonensis]MDQ0338767.1 hypothetical protein [Caldalkalibacillus uzonensis]
MQLTNHHFDVFDRDSYEYRVNSPNAEQVRQEYQTAWQDWNRLMDLTLTRLEGDGIKKERTENWQNSGRLSRRFWTRFSVKID